MMLLKTIILDIVYLYICLLILRSLLYYSGMNRTEPAARLTILLSQPLLRPIQPFFPCIKGFETVSLFMAYLLTWATQIFYLFFVINHQFSFNLLLASKIFAIIYWISSILTVYCIVILISIILRIFAPLSPASGHIEKITAPLRQPFHMLKLGLFDFSILPFFFVAQWLTVWGLPELSRITRVIIGM